VRDEQTGWVPNNSHGYYCECLGCRINPPRREPVKGKWEFDQAKKVWRLVK
jgi:hypothetical protein